ncbi:hypothetical protein ANN_08203 [Periplaneta americana]|uniref:DUF659 domain-containing protein n=1 Tax=Periplaneta americana TaxID=6978 RepID=A0ABQ8T263_PERAM|nr:hypothetical protein ANN_08203 [Periplaneta americana]
MAGLCDGGNEPPGSLKAIRAYSVSFTALQRELKQPLVVAELHTSVHSRFCLGPITPDCVIGGTLRAIVEEQLEEEQFGFSKGKALYGAETWTLPLRRSEEKRLEAFEMWIWRRMKRVKWTDRKKNEAVFERCAVSSTQKFLVQQHNTTSKHQANKQLNSKQRQLFLTQPTTSNVRSEFNIDLCRSLISADIPLYKLKNKVFREFLEKYTQHTIPDESTLRKTYAPSIYDETIQKIRDEIKDSSIWVSIDETPDKEGRLVGNVVIGLLSEQYSERILLHCDVLEKCNNKTIVKLFNEAMGILWPKGIMYDNVLFFISVAAPYMVKAGQALSVVYPKLTHFTCVAHAFHRVAEVVRDNFLM